MGEGMEHRPSSDPHPAAGLEPGYPPSVLLLDDGELADVRRLLEDLEIDFIHRRGTGIGEGLELPADLLITTARLAQSLPRSARRRTAPGEAGVAPVRVVVTSEEATTLRQKLRRDGVDFLVRRPVYSEALRLIELRSVYRGPEKRGAVRVPIGSTIQVASEGAPPLDAVLIELSLSGGRFVSASSFEEGARIVLELATRDARSGAPDPLRLEARVVRSACETNGAGRGEWAVAVAFESLSDSASVSLAALVHSRAIGSLAGHEGCDERRRSPRRAFAERVASLDERARRALVGRDLSVGGMRVEPHPDLAVGDELRLAIYGFEARLPAIVTAVVVRDDGDAGLGLRFTAVPPEVARHLEGLVAHLPPIEPLAGGETGALGAVLSEILG